MASHQAATIAFLTLPILVILWRRYRASCSTAVRVATREDHQSLLCLRAHTATRTGGQKQPRDTYNSIHQLGHTIELEQLLVLPDLAGGIRAAACLLLEPKFSRGGTMAGHLSSVMSLDDNDDGAGKEFIRQLLEIASQRGCYKVITNATMADASFFVRCGFVEKELTMTAELSVPEADSQSQSALCKGLAQVFSNLREVEPRLDGYMLRPLAASDTVCDANAPGSRVDCFRTFHCAPHCVSSISLPAALIHLSECFAHTTTPSCAQGASYIRLLQQLSPAPPLDQATFERQHARVVSGIFEMNDPFELLEMTLPERCDVLPSNHEHDLPTVRI